MLGAAPISKALYRLGLPELNELKTQLQKNYLAKASYGLVIYVGVPWFYL